MNNENDVKVVVVDKRSKPRNGLLFIFGAVLCTYLLKKKNMI